MQPEFLITGASGQLGRHLLDLLGERARGLDLPDLDITSPGSVEEAVDRFQPGCIINCAAITDVDRCQREPLEAMAVHRDGVGHLAGTGIRLLTISTDHVFTGSCETERPFLEDDVPDPANEYGRTKLMGESLALEAGSDNIVVRTSWMFSAERGLCTFIRNSLVNGGSVRAVSDQTACLTYAPDLAAAIIELAEGKGGGIYHLVNRPGTTPARLAERLAADTGGSVIRVSWSDLDLDAPRPFYSELGTMREIALPDLDDALERWRRSHE